MEDFFTWLVQKPSPLAVLTLLIVLFIVILVKNEAVADFFKWVFRLKHKRTCGDCILVLFGMKEKFNAERERVKNSVLRDQMSYYEQKSQEFLFSMLNSYQIELDSFTSEKVTKRISQFSIYKETLKNSLFLMKDEIRRSFKENGFVTLSDQMFQSYVRSKAHTLRAIAQSYFSLYDDNYPETLVSMSDKLKNFDMVLFEKWLLDIFMNSKEVVLESNRKEDELMLKFKNDIDAFVYNRKTPEEFGK